MKNKFLYLVLSLITCFSFVGRVFAEDLDFTVSTSVVGGKDTVVKGETAVINVNVKSDLHISACTFKVSSDSGVEYVSAKQANGYVLQTGSDGKISVDGAVDDTTPTNMTLLQLNYKVNNNGKVTIKTLDCTSPTDNKTGSYDDVVVELKTIDLSQNTTLSKLVVNGGVLSPSFSSNVKSYSIQLTGTNFSLDLTASNSDYQDDIVVTDASGKTLDPKKIVFTNYDNQGSMPISVTVNKDTVYNLLAVYEEDKLDNSLKSLKIDGKEIEIENGKYDYTVKIENSVKSVKIEATLVDSENFKFTDEFNGTQMIQTPSSSTSYPIIIEPSKSSVGGKGVTYTIKLVKDGNNNSGTTNNNNNQNTNTNPSTGGLSIYLMFLILIISLIGSIFIYQKNLESYK